MNPTYIYYNYIQYHGYVLLSACGGCSTLAARIEQRLFVFCDPKTRARFLTQKWGHNTKMNSPASKFVIQFWAHGICVLPSAKSALSCDRLHLSFMFSCAWCQDAGFTVYIYNYIDIDILYPILGGDYLYNSRIEILEKY